MRRIRPFLAMVALVAIIALGLSLPAFAQESSLIEGSVKDEQGAAIVGATVTVKNKDSGAQSSATSDSSGLYDVTNLPRGRYDVVVQANGFTPQTQKDITLQVATRVTLDFTLQKSTAEAPPVPTPQPLEAAPSPTPPPAAAPQNQVPSSTTIQPSSTETLPHTGQPLVFSFALLGGLLAVAFGLLLRRLAIPL